MTVSVAADDTISSIGIVIPDGTQLFIILLAVAAGMNDVDSNLLDKMGDVYTELTAVKPVTLVVDLKSANSNADSDVDAHIFFQKSFVYDNGTDPPQDYSIDVQLSEALTDNTGITRVISTDDLFPILEKYRVELLMFDTLEVIFPDNYIMFDEDHNEYFIVEVV